MQTTAIEGPLPHTPEWNALRLYDPDRKERPVVFGASDSYTACTNPLQAYLAKRGEIPAWKPDEETQDRLDVGQAIEPAIISLYEKREDCEVIRDLPMYFAPLHPYIAATPDGIAIKSQDDIRGVEAKNSGFRMFGDDVDKFGEEETDEIPIRYIFQAQQQCFVMGLQKIDFPVLKSGSSFKIYRIDRDDSFIADMVDSLQELAERIVNGDPPEPEYAHPGTRKLLREVHGCNAGEVATLGKVALQEWLRIEELKLREKVAKEEKDELLNRILHQSGSSQFIEFVESSVRVKKVVVKDSFVTQKDIDEATAKLGQIKRAGHFRLQRTASK